MEALIVDVESELKFISREIETLKKKKDRIKNEGDPKTLIHTTRPSLLHYILFILDTKKF